MAGVLAVIGGVAVAVLVAAGVVLLARAVVAPELGEPGESAPPEEEER